MSSRPAFAFAGEDPQNYALASSLTHYWDVATLTWVKGTQPGAGVGGSLTDAELRAAPVPVSGTFWQATQPVSLTHSALTGASPTAASVGVASAEAVAANANRKGLVLVNVSSNVISLGFGAAAVLNSGITLNALGGAWTMNKETFTTQQVQAIAGGAASPLAVQEFT